MEANNTISASTFKHFKSPKTVIARFVAKRSLKSATVWAFIIGAYTASKVIGYVKAYPTAADQANLAHSLGSNTGMAALLGTPHDLTTIAGYTNWVTMGFITLIGAVWAFLLATKYFRGEEDSGRSELLLSGQTTARQSAISTLVGLSVNLVVLYMIISVIFVAIGKYKGVGIGVQDSLFFALAASSGVAFFLAVGAFTSQLMPTRTRASTVAAAIFGISFILRSIADTTSAHWLLNVTPLGWVEKLLPLVGSDTVWLVPIFASVAVLYALTIWLAGRRDLGDSLFADHDSAVARTGLLNSPLMTAIRLSRASFIGWLLAITSMAFLYGSLTKTVTQIQTKSIDKALNRLTGSSYQVNIATIFLGVIFLMLIVTVMAYVANAVGKVREDEANGYIDNFLVQPVTRLRWLSERIMLATVTSLILGVWAGQATGHLGIPLHRLLEAGVNMIAPVVFTLGAAVLAFGIIPRFTSLIAYSVLGWSFLITLVSSGTNLNHWILDTSVLYQTALAPAVNPHWMTDVVMVVLGVVLTFIGMFAFNARDLATE